MIEAKIKRIDDKNVQCDLRVSGHPNDVVAEVGALVNGVVEAISRKVNGKISREEISDVILERIVLQLEGALNEAD